MNTSEENRKNGLSGIYGLKLTFGNRNLVVFLICLVIASLLWFFDAMSKTYTATLAHPVEYTNFPRNKFIINNPPRHINLKLAGRGFSLMRQKVTMSFSPLVISVEELISSTPSTSTGTHTVRASDLREIVNVQLSSDLQLLGITPEEFTMAFDSLGSKVVPVASGIQLGFKPRYGLVSPLQFSPFLVKITGPRNIIEQFDSIKTEPKVFKNLDASFTLEVPLELPVQLYVDPQKVMLTARIDEFTEKSIMVPVWIDNQPDQARIRLFPNEVEVSFRIGLSDYSLIKPENFSLYVSWEDIVARKSSLQVKVRKMPPEVSSFKISPENVEYLIEKN